MSTWELAPPSSLLFFSPSFFAQTYPIAYLCGMSCKISGCVTSKPAGKTAPFFVDGPPVLVLSRRNSVGCLITDPGQFSLGNWETDTVISASSSLDIVDMCEREERRRPRETRIPLDASHLFVGSSNVPRYRTSNSARSCDSVSRSPTTLLHSYTCNDIKQKTTNNATGRIISWQGRTCRRIS